jgi:hypothetical protein
MKKMMKEEIEEDKTDIETLIRLTADNSPEELNEK